MKTAENALTEWVVNRVHFDGGNRKQVWGTEDIEALGRWLNGEVTTLRIKQTLGPEWESRIEWDLATRVQSILARRKWRVTARELARYDSLMEYYQRLVFLNTKPDFGTHKAHKGGKR